MDKDASETKLLSEITHSIFNEIYRRKELSIVFEDDHIIVIDKPNGVLSVPSYPDTPSLAKTVHEYLKPNLKLEQLAVHRLGMDTSGLIVMGKTMENIRTLHEMFRTRKVTRQYTALVCGHVLNDEGLLSMQLMRDYEYPPYMRVSTKEHQAALLGLDPEVVGKKILQAPKTALTHYVVEQREQIDNDPDLPVTRLRLTSISGRTHQLNVHLAAFGFPIVQDRVYGFDGKAAPFGGLDLPQCKLDPAVVEAVFAATADRNMCIHASLIRLRHPQEKTVVEFTSTPPF